MAMFCYQCQETLNNKGCTVGGVCGKNERVANLEDVLVYVAKGISVVADKAGKVDPEVGRFISKALFTTITNVNFDEDSIAELISEGLRFRDELKKKYNISDEGLHDSATWNATTKEEFLAKHKDAGVLAETNEDIRSLKETIIYGLKGVGAYAEHASVLGYEDQSLWDELIDCLAATTKELSVDELIGYVMKTGEAAVKAMAILDKANTETYGHPEITEVNIGVRNRPGILISGHDLKDMEELLEQTKDAGVDVYTHGEMLPANYYPAFKKYDHFVGNYGNAWWLQHKEFEAFNGPILMTTNCLVPPRESYKDRVFTTGNVRFPGVKHIPDRVDGKPKDFSEIVEMAKKCPPPTQLESGKIVGGFAHEQVFKLADKVVDAVKSGAIRKFVVMAGCDGRHKTREYYTEFAKKLPKDTVILTAGCAKFRYIKLNLGDIGGIPRVLDAGQCNDSYSLALIAMKLKEVFGLNDINELPIAYNIAWYEQKAVAVLLALLYLGVKNIKLGPTLPAFLSPAVLKVLAENFGITTISNVDDDMKELIG
ncbi:hydroxylamine reductase [Hippea sp. KM1]|uniref:hydroxylamine reductase n=1 Tax=Hippea sp. KM1 TaxID=944481 RepID=UPI00046CA3E0|nr:hydroxylamine reductase [Hippea sp. KM1]